MTAPSDLDRSPNDPSLISFGKRAAIIILVICAIVVFWMLYKVFTTAPAENRPQREFTIVQKIKYDRLLRKHGLQYEVSVIEVRADETMWFEREGQLCQLK